ncbi:MAG: hypothetical protein WCA00_04970, partial [Candidatus Acidiferrales bacterium]
MPCPPLDAPAVNIPAAKNEPQRHQGVRRLAAACYDVNLAPARLIQPSSAWQGRRLLRRSSFPGSVRWFSICRGGSQTRPAFEFVPAAFFFMSFDFLCVSAIDQVLSTA